MIRDDAAGRIRQILGFRTDLFNESLDAIREAQEDAEAGELGYQVDGSHPRSESGSAVASRNDYLHLVIYVRCCYGR